MQVLRSATMLHGRSCAKWATLNWANICDVDPRMTRPLRIHAPGMLYHVFSRGNDKRCIFIDDTDSQSFLDLLATTVPRFDVRCVAYCLVWNHYHVLLKAGQFPISRLMQQLNSSYCQRFNRRHRRVGHVLQGRFGSKIIENGLYARTALRYLALNPVEAGYVSDPKDWPWGSYRYVTGPSAPPAFLSLEEAWSAFGTSDPLLGRSRFADFVVGGVPDSSTNALLHGSERLAATVAPLLRPHEHTREYVYAQRYAARPPVDALFDDCVTQAELDDAAWRAFHQHAYTLEAIGRVVARDPSVVCRWIQRAKRTGDPSGSSSDEDVPARNKI
jgi:REP element-mobilizing transposase RayT